jgi:hypothetical protein
VRRSSRINPTEVNLLLAGKGEKFKKAIQNQFRKNKSERPIFIFGSSPTQGIIWK